MKQTVEEAAEKCRDVMVKDNGGSQYDFVSGDIKDAFKAGAEWQAKQSPWISVEDRLPDFGKNVLAAYIYKGRIDIQEMSYFGGKEWSFDDTKVICWMPIPSFDNILEANKDVLQRMKEKGD